MIVVPLPAGTEAFKIFGICTAVFGGFCVKRIEFTVGNVAEKRVHFSCRGGIQTLKIGIQHFDTYIMFVAQCGNLVFNILIVYMIGNFFRHMLGFIHLNRFIKTV